MDTLLPEDLQRRFVALDDIVVAPKAERHEFYERRIVWLGVTLTILGLGGGFALVMLSPDAPALPMILLMLMGALGVGMLMLVKSLARRWWRRVADRHAASARAQEETVVNWWRDVRRFLEEEGIGSLVITEGMSKGRWKVRGFFLENPVNMKQQIQMQESFTQEELSREVTPFVLNGKVNLMTTKNKPLRAPYGAGETRIITDDRGTRMAVDAALAQELKG